MKNENEVKHSPTPWRQAKGFYCEIEDANGDHILTSTSHYNPKLGDEQCRANAEFILEAVNSHERLVAENARLREQVRRLIDKLDDAWDFINRFDSRAEEVCDDLHETMDEARAALGEEAKDGND